MGLGGPPACLAAWDSGSIPVTYKKKKVKEKPPTDARKRKYFDWLFAYLMNFNYKFHKH